MSELTLFPEHIYFENGRSEVQAMQIASRLRSIGLSVLEGSAAYAGVARRLKREGIGNLMQLVALTNAQTKEWHGAGRVFVETVNRLRKEVMAHPEHYIATWELQVKPVVLPDDLEKPKDDTDDFFGTSWEAREVVPHDAMMCEETPSSYRSTAERIVLLEKSLVAAIQVLQNRWKDAGILRKYFIDGQSPQYIAQSRGFVSAAALRHQISRCFLKPLLEGEEVHGVRFAQSLLHDVQLLKEELCYATAHHLDALDTLVPERFLNIFGLTLMQRRQNDAAWQSDFIVRIGEVQQCRRTLHGVFAVMQDRIVGCTEKSIVRMVRERAQLPNGRFAQGIVVPHRAFLHSMLQQHCWIERSRRGYRLVSMQVAQCMMRIARIVHDARKPISTTEILRIYEQIYMERPCSMNITHLHRRFPHICSVRRGVWEYRG